MKKALTIVAAALLMTAVALPSRAGVDIGLKGGLNITNMSFRSHSLDRSNNAGFFIGPTLKVTLPLGGLGFDISALYDQREAEISDFYDDYMPETVTRKSINIPINIRYSFGLGSLASVYIAAGPQFGFNVGHKDFGINDVMDFEMEDNDVSVNVGAGVTLIRHIEFAFTYNIVCGKSGKYDIWQENFSHRKKSRLNAWQVSAAFYF